MILGGGCWEEDGMRLWSRGECSPMRTLLWGFVVEGTVKKDIVEDATGNGKEKFKVEEERDEKLKDV